MDDRTGALDGGRPHGGRALDLRTTGAAASRPRTIPHGSSWRGEGRAPATAVPTALTCHWRRPCSAATDRFRSSLPRSASDLHLVANPSVDCRSRSCRPCDRTRAAVRGGSQEVTVKVLFIQNNGIQESIGIANLSGILK